MAFDAEREVAEQVHVRRLHEALPVLRREPCGKLAQVPPVGFERIFRKAVLEPQRVAELINDIRRLFHRFHESTGPLIIPVHGVSGEW